MPEQSSSAVHGVHAPDLQVEAAGSEQSADFRQATHFAAFVSQKGVARSVQSLAAAHSTQVWDAASQVGVGALQWLRLRHSTHSSTSASQCGVAPLHSPLHGGASALPAAPLEPAAESGLVSRSPPAPSLNPASPLPPLSPALAPPLPLRPPDALPLSSSDPGQSP